MRGSERCTKLRNTLLGLPMPPQSHAPSILSTTEAYQTIAPD